MTPEVVRDCSYRGHSDAELVLRSYCPSQVMISPLSKEQLFVISETATSTARQLPSSMMASGL